MMARKAAFDSDTNFALFCEQIDYRYPSNLLEVDNEGLMVEFMGDEPDPQIVGLVRNYGGWFDDD